MMDLEQAYIGTKADSRAIRAADTVALPSLSGRLSRETIEIINSLLDGLYFGQVIWGTSTLTVDIVSNNL